MRNILLISSVFLASVLTGCAPADLKGQVDRLERSLNDLRALQTEQTESVAAMDRQVRELSGRVEEIEFAQKGRIGTDLTSLKDDLTSLKKRVPPPSIVPSSELEIDEVWANNLAGESKEAFSGGLQKLREGEFADALSLLQTTLELTEGTDKAGVVLFWLGVANDGLGDEKGALKAYTEVASRFTKSPRAPTSLLRQGDVLLRLGDRKTAALSWQKLVADYPKSSEAYRAKEKLKDTR